MLKDWTDGLIDRDRKKNEDGMNGLVGKGTKYAVMTVMAVIGLAGPASAGANCETYARLTLQQAKKNVDKRCGFKGVRWSLQASKHRDWCKAEGPAKWRAELKLRDSMLKGCK